LSKAYRSICPVEWLEKWNEARDAGEWWGKY
jgi:cytochrome c oxidase subunit 6b